MAKAKKKMFFTPAAVEFYESAVENFELESHHKTLLTQAAHSLDRAELARLEIEKTGAYQKDRYGNPKQIPAVKDEKDHRLLFSKLLRELCLDSDSTNETRPPRVNY